MSEIDDQTTEDLKEVLSLARTAIDQEFAIAERLDSKARDRRREHDCCD
jgi:hypothetical protein